jgi:hypothetical protein
MRGDPKLEGAFTGSLVAESEARYGTLCAFCRINLDEDNNSILALKYPLGGDTIHVQMPHNVSLIHSFGFSSAVMRCLISLGMVVFSPFR